MFWIPTEYGSIDGNRHQFMGTSRPRENIPRTRGTLLHCCSLGADKKDSTLPLVISVDQVPYLPHAYIPTSGRSKTTREMQRARAIPKSCLTNIPLHIRSGVGVQPLHRGPVSLPTTPGSPPRSSVPAHHSSLFTAVQYPCPPLQPLHRGPVSLHTTTGPQSCRAAAA